MTDMNDNNQWIHPERDPRFEQVVNPYAQPIVAQQTPDPQSLATPKRTIGVRSAIALALAAAVGSGTLTGIYATQLSTNNQSQGQVIAALNAPVSHGVTPDMPTGGVQEVAAKVLPAVVSLKVSDSTGVSEGSGSVLSPDGYILTNNHVVEGTAGDPHRTLITVVFNDGRRMQARFVAGDPNTDVAVVKIDDVQDLPVMSFGDSSSIQVGQPVVAVGAPLGLSSTVTTGVISAINRPVRASSRDLGQSSLIDAIQTDAAINPGNSGGPLVDMNGNQIGINSMIASIPHNGDSAGSIGLGFAIPANFAKRVAQQLIESGEAKQPMIGIRLGNDPRIVGAVIADTTSGSPGETAGLRPGDVVVGFGDRRIDSADALIAAVRSADFGQTITLKLTDLRGENPREVEVRLSDE
ncbi:trypsin-like peptidase domain-containing protein [Corynebacterium sp. ES2794-CONJ1]|uniref:S1C family serine protease n=1 Tax=unclassified Corynebacterium TaxID=2624378 RepID=UPI002167CA5B|nr:MULTISPECIES: trypsin-like peptidase domain-containing protein [unclassified Corynebacterium]MCS4490016.1 trypsin-like peptidase domain-containing protein [Corynebacterium sp. ES2775-CONJ]MCS4491622.1 trypsin-like peptidase domain-containing protein [Corynebacterium sp. ES2715-CONJ3]MCS4531726.1 trypsin-like peptidase domain-containing protein [Corynebacterium sp. ES2730-CONJ]MCU9519122.1 trypsin-like peptidase domain-containing protein [Corynebacterium sp. ES2794-CONJ1]